MNHYNLRKAVPKEALPSISFHLSIAGIGHRFIGGELGRMKVLEVATKRGETATDFAKKKALVETIIKVSGEYGSN